MRGRLNGLGILAAVVSCLLTQAATASCDAPAQVRLTPTDANPRATSAEISGGVPRGDRDCFTIVARAGQHLSVSQPGRTQTNIVLQLYQPPWHVHRGEDSIEIAGRALPGAADGADATHWSGVLSRSGGYLLVVGTSWGGGEYRLRLVLR